MSVHIEVSFGELIDKLTILEIKAVRIRDQKKKDHISRELSALNAVGDNIGTAQSQFELAKLRDNLKTVNEKLWDIEDAIREKERQKLFDASFIDLARSVYITNDQRALLKSRIDEIMGSSITEVKSYQPY